MRTEFQLGEDQVITAIKVVLSRRNLEALLAKLNQHPPESFCTLEGPSLYFPTIVVAVEENDEHYAHPSREGLAAGPLHPDTEQQITPETNSG